MLFINTSPSKPGCHVSSWTQPCQKVVLLTVRLALPLQLLPALMFNLFVRTSVCVLTGEELITQGWPNNQMFFLRNNTGYVDMVLKADGREQIIETLAGGTCFGEAALLPLPSAEALQKVGSCYIPAQRNWGHLRRRG